MTVYAIVKNLDCGYLHDRERAEEYGWKIGDRFTVTDVSMGQSYTTIYLEGYGTSGVNSVFFDFEEDGEPLNIFSDPRFNPYLMQGDLVTRLRKRAEIRRQIPNRKSVQNNEPDRLADLLDEAANALETTTRELKWYQDNDTKEY